MGQGMWKLVVLLLVVVAGSGFAFIKPTTEFSFNPATGQARFIDTKDNRVQVDDFKVSKNPDGTFNCEFKQLLVENQSSPVINANVNQMLAFAEQQRAANEGIKAAFDGITNVAAQIMPGLAMLKGMQGTQAEDISRFESALQRLNEIKEKLQPPKPATQPAAQ
jgi:hypothetical protein